MNAVPVLLHSVTQMVFQKEKMHCFLYTPLSPAEISFLYFKFQIALKTLSNTL